MKAYSKDVRERGLRAVDQGRPRAEIVQIFGVSLAAIKRYRRTIPNHQKVAETLREFQAE